MKYLLFLLVLASCATDPKTEPVSKPAPVKTPIVKPIVRPNPPKSPGKDGVVVGECFISSVSDAVYKVIRCNDFYCLVKTEVFGETTMEREYVSKQLDIPCPEGLK